MRSKIIAAAIAALMVLLCSVVIPTNTASAAVQNLNDQMTVEDGSTTEFGGGDQFIVRFGEDAAFGVVWGTEENPNSIYIVSYMSRYLGYMDIYDSQGDLLKDDHMIKMYSVYAVKMDSLVEFNDANGDGTVRYWRTLDPATGEYSNYIPALGPFTQEPLYKRVSLNTSWAATAPVMTEEDGKKSWTFSLTAQNLHYIGISDGADTSGVLDNITLTFKLDASTVYVEDASVPQYSIDMSTGGWFSNLQKVADKTVSGDITSYHVKWDKEIKGWDYEAENDNRALLMEFDNLVGNFIPPAADWVMAFNLYVRMVEAMGGGAYMRADTGSETIYNGTSTVTGNGQALSTPRLTFGGERTSVATFEWVQNCTVDGDEVQSHSQVTWIFPFRTWSWGGMQFTGFAVLTGITFPGGAEIYQDPSVSSEVMTDVGPLPISVSGDPLNFPIGLLFVVGAVVIMVGAVVMRRRGGRSGPVSYEKLDQQPPQEDWSTYYDNK